MSLGDDTIMLLLSSDLVQEIQKGVSGGLKRAAFYLYTFAIAYITLIGGYTTK